MTTTEPSAAVPVIQADREAADERSLLADILGVSPADARFVADGVFNFDRALSVLKNALATTPTPPSTEAQGEGEGMGAILHREIIDAVWSKLPRERLSCSDDESGTQLSLARQRKWSADAVKNVLARHRQQSSASGVGELAPSDRERMHAAWTDLGDHLGHEAAALSTPPPAAPASKGSAYDRLEQHLDEHYYPGARDDLREVATPSPVSEGSTRSTAGQPDGALREAIRDEIVNTPETADFMAGVPLEAAHQRERWGVQHDGGKTPFDWFWLIGYLAQKAASAQVAGDDEKARHHTISTAAALANWHAQITGMTDMRPGIGPANGGEKPGSAFALAAALAANVQPEVG